MRFTSRPLRASFLAAIAAASLIPCLARAADPESPPAKDGFTLFNPTPDADLRIFSPDRPDKSTSPLSLDAGHVQIETDLFGTLYAHGGGASMRQFFSADPVVKLGVTNDIDVEISLGGYQIIRMTEGATGKVRNVSGFGDVVVRAKLNLVGNDGGAVAAAIEPTFKIPTATAGVGNGAGEFGVIAPLQFPLPLDITALFVTEFDDLKNPANTGRHAGFTNLINLSHAVTANLTAEAELWSQVQPGQAASQYSVDLAMAYAITPNTQIDAAIYAGLNRATPALVGYIGFAQRF